MATRLLIVGVGSIGERHVRCFQQTGRVDVTICETNISLAEQVRARYGIAAAFPSLGEAWSAGVYDAVVIATPAHLHIEMAQAAVERGLHVMLEKPLSTNETGIAALQSAVQQKQVQFMVAYVLRCHPVLVAMRDAILSGRWGSPKQLYTTVGQHFPTYRPAYRDIYYRSRATGGGAIQDALTHTLNAAEWLVGPIQQLVADADHLLLDGVEVEDTVNVLARHGQVLSGHAYNQHQAPNEHTITVVCERGTVRFEGHYSRWGWMNHPGNVWEYESFPPLERDTLFVTQAHRFLDVIAGKASPPCTLEEAWQTLRVNLAALASLTNQAKWTHL